MRTIRSTTVFQRAIALAIVGLVAGCAARRSSAAVDFPDPRPLSPVEARMLADGAGGTFHRFSLIDAALVASGIERDADRARYRRKYALWRDAARRSIAAEPSPLRRAAALFAFMHRKILTGNYDAAATELTHPLDEGRFNCASATLLFTALATDCGLTVHAIERPRHAMCVLEIDGRRTDVETTCPNWFEIAPAVRRQAEIALAMRHARDDKMAGGGVSGDAKIGASSTGDRAALGREIGPAALVAMIYYNRGVDRLRERRYAAAVSENLRALRLDPINETARGNLLAAIDNWALARSAAGDYRAAADLLARGLAIAPDHEPFLRQSAACVSHLDSIARRRRRAARSDRHPRRREKSRPQLARLESLVAKIGALTGTSAIESLPATASWRVGFIRLSKLPAPDPRPPTPDPRPPPPDPPTPPPTPDPRPPAPDPRPPTPDPRPPDPRPPASSCRCEPPSGGVS